MKRTVRFGMLTGFCLALAACCISQEAKNEISANAAVGAGIYKDWSSLSDDQQRQAYWKAIRAFHSLDHSINDKPVPSEFQNDPWAIAPVGSDVAPVGSGR